MSDERLDKAWQKNGLGGYSVQAILGTLNHYGASVDEAGLGELTRSKYPLEIAQLWADGWKGTGQFAKLPWEAASELWRRANPDRLAPHEFAGALVRLMGVLERMRQGAQDAPVGPAFEKVEELKPRVPLVEGKPDPRFMFEVSVHLGEGLDLCGQLAEKLAKEGHAEEAEAFIQVEEFVFPAWAGISRAMIRAGRGEEEAAIRDLEAIGRDPAREGESRVSALDALIALDAQGPAQDCARSLLDEAEGKGDFHLALAAGERLAALLEQVQDEEALEALLERMERLDQAHAAAHPEHEHG